MKNKLLILIITVTITPSIVFASWWNPFSWFKKKSFVPVVEQVEQKKIINDIPVENTEFVKNKPVKVKFTKKEESSQKENIQNNKSDIIISTTPSIESKQIDEVNNIILQSLKSRLIQFPQAISMITNSYATKKRIATSGINLCNTAYVNSLEKAKSDYEYMKTRTRTSGSGGIMNMGTLNNLDSLYSQDINTINSNKENCLIKYNISDASIEEDLNQISRRVIQLQSLVNSPQDALNYQNEVSVLEDRLLIVASKVGSY